VLSLESFTPSPEIIKLIASIEAFRGSWRALKNMAPEHLAQLRHVATIESIGSSTRIEGSRLSDKEVDALLANIAIQEFSARDVQEIVGYAEVMDLVFERWSAMPLSEATIRQLHRLLLTHRPQDDWHRGAYKTTSNTVAAFDAESNPIAVVFQTADPFDTPRLMTELVTWTNDELTTGSHHPLLIIGAFVVVLLNIHPFQDGNGRLSRILTTLLLLRAGYSYVPYSSLESVIERNKADYYRSLRQTQRTLATERPDWLPWLEFFLTAMQRQATHLQVKAEYLLSVTAAEPALDHQIVEVIRQKSRVTMGDLVQATNANRNTLKGRLRELVVRGQVIQHETGRRTWYNLP